MDTTIDLALKLVEKELAGKWLFFW
jgi:hypothetical protein